MIRDPALTAELAELEATAAAAAKRLREAPVPPLPPDVAEHLLRSAENETDPVLRAWYMRSLTGPGGGE